LVDDSENLESVNLQFSSYQKPHMFLCLDW